MRVSAISHSVIAIETAEDVHAPNMPKFCECGTIADGKKGEPLADIFSPWHAHHVITAINADNFARCVHPVI